MRLDNHFTPILILDCLFELANIHHVPFEGLVSDPEKPDNSLLHTEDVVGKSGSGRSMRALTRSPEEEDGALKHALPN